MASFITSVTDEMYGRPGGTYTNRGTYIPTPVVTAYADTFASDPTIRTPKDAGYVQTRARFTSIPRKYHVRYEALTTHDKNLIYKFEKDTVVGGSEEFLWPLSTDTTQELTVRFAGIVTYIPWEDTNYTRWIVEFDVESVGGI